jgi:uncharacterized protein (UPF0276 family)
MLHTVKYEDDLVPLPTEETVLQDMTDGINEIERCYEMEINVEKKLR